MPTPGELVSILSLVLGGGVVGTTIKSFFDRRSLGATADRTVVQTATDLVATLEGQLEKVNKLLEWHEAERARYERERRESDERIDVHLRWDRRARWLCEEAVPPIILGPAPPLYPPSAAGTMTS